MTVYTDLQARALTALRHGTPKHKWDGVADIIVQDRQRVEARLRTQPLPDNFRHFQDALRLQSHARLPMSVPNVAELRRYFDIHPVHKGSHIFSFDGRPQEMARVHEGFPMSGYRADQVMRAPGLVDVLNDPRLIDLIEAYLGCVPTLYSVNAWWSHPADKPEMTNVQYFHRDSDDWRFVTLFIYLTDVDVDGGPHQVVPGSHTVDGMKALVRKASWWPKFDAEHSFIEDMGEDFSRSCERLFGRTAVSLTGAAGSMFLVNTLALHRGIVPAKTPRLVVWARYGLGPNTNSVDLEQGPLGWWQVPTNMEDTPRNRYVNRLLFDFDSRPETIRPPL
jgi:Phytanoyl-CoA dioxygenase (PhyH)